MSTKASESQIMIYSFSGILLSNKKKEMTNIDNMDEYQRHIAK